MQHNNSGAREMFTDVFIVFLNGRRIECDLEKWDSFDNLFDYEPIKNIFLILKSSEVLIVCQLEMFRKKERLMLQTGGN